MSVLFGIHEYLLNTKIFIFQYQASKEYKFQELGIHPQQLSAWQVPHYQKDWMDHLRFLVSISSFINISFPPLNFFFYVYVNIYVT